MLTSMDTEKNHLIKFNTHKLLADWKQRELSESILKFTIYIILNGKLFKKVSSVIKNKTRMPVYTISFQCFTAGSKQWNKAKEKMHSNLKGWNKRSF